MDYIDAHEQASTGFLCDKANDQPQCSCTDRACVKPKCAADALHGCKAPRYRWHLGCILLKMPAVPLLTGPTEWDGDYGGKASAPCTETGRDTGVFVRDYPKATVQWDCRKA